MMRRIAMAVLAVLAAPADASAERRFGVMTDVGVPDGANASIVIRPVRALRLHGGVGHNYVSRGVRAGVTLVPLGTWVSPTLTLAYGRYEDGDANPLVQMLTRDPDFSSPLLERVGYDYANAHVGLELGREWFTFYIHAGMSRITSELHVPDTETITFTEPPRTTAWVPSANLGFVFYLVK